MICNVCQKNLNERNLISGYLLRPSLVKLIQTEHPDFGEESFICEEDLRHYRIIYLTDMVKDKNGSMHDIDEEVVKSIADNDFISMNVNNKIKEEISVGDKIADKVAEFGGSWKFIISFFSILLSWIVINSIALISKTFDPYPFILLNLILSCLAAIQAPIIMMSQNRQETKDRQRSENDYKVNLKAELEIKTLNEKIDHLIADLWELSQKSSKNSRE